jgi:hypothetical protein
MEGYPTVVTLDACLPTKAAVKMLAKALKKCVRCRVGSRGRSAARDIRVVARAVISERRSLHRESES